MATTLRSAYLYKPQEPTKSRSTVSAASSKQVAAFSKDIHGHDTKRRSDHVVVDIAKISTPQSSKAELASLTMTYKSLLDRISQLEKTVGDNTAKLESLQERNSQLRTTSATQEREISQLNEFLKAKQAQFQSERESGRSLPQNQKTIVVMQPSSNVVWSTSSPSAKTNSFDVSSRGSVNSNSSKNSKNSSTTAPSHRSS